MVYTLEINEEQINLIIKNFKEYEVNKTNEYQSFRAKVASDSITIFNTGKLLIQGSNPTNLYQKIGLLLNINVDIKEDKKEAKAPSFSYSIIGTDEVGTGDYFGPIVVSACFVPYENQLKLLKMGVKDSKKIKDSEIKKLGEYLIKNTINASVIINNNQYNEMMKQDNMNMNKLKALLHNRAINNILPKVNKYDKIIVDAFCSQNKYYEYLNGYKDVHTQAILEEKAEDKYIAVGCASIIARYHFLKAFDKLCSDYSYNLPKGAGEKVDQMIERIRKDKKEEILVSIAKIGFKNTTK